MWAEALWVVSTLPSAWQLPEEEEQQAQKPRVRNEPGVTGMENKGASGEAGSPRGVGAVSHLPLATVRGARAPLLPGSSPRRIWVKMESSLAKAPPGTPAARKCPAQPTELVEERWAPGAAESQCAEDDTREPGLLGHLRAPAGDSRLQAPCSKDRTQPEWASADQTPDNWVLREMNPCVQDAWREGSPGWGRRYNHCPGQDSEWLNWANCPWWRCWVSFPATWKPPDKSRLRSPLWNYWSGLFRKDGGLFLIKTEVLITRLHIPGWSPGQDQQTTWPETLGALSVKCQWELWITGFTQCYFSLGMTLIQRKDEWVFIILVWIFSQTQKYEGQ